jgi:hypothetical protein
MPTISRTIYHSTSTTAWIPVNVVSTASTTVSTTFYNCWVDEMYDQRTTSISAQWFTTDCTGPITRTYEFYEPTAEQIEENRRNREFVLAETARREAELARAQREARRANRRALVLLMMLMSPEQRAEFRQHGHFHVIGAKTGQRYRIRRGTIGNVDVLDGERVKHRLCAHPTGVPEFDVLAAQLLHLQEAANEEQFVRTANIHPARR